MKKKAFTGWLWRNASGATAIEYAMIAAGISIVIVGALALMSGSLTNIFNTVSSSL
ncbi:MAG: Flp family type IVb pilin [Rhodospirillaceae bacterium]|jgi:pilus assembly protein Flp/PilA|nr:Flp family type IVb pilin [Rhodospirillaceae bacterium]MBT5666171.1 Flp family type IVb pilin [Rhodospirillaceae bacterium]MBT5811691.1 Flp family type IVb pilin [Rhodospirillaceae bacterium]